MDRLENIYKLHRILKARSTPIGPPALADRLDCSESTVYRVVEDLRDQLGAPVDRIRGRGWVLNKSQHYELPGLWFNASEIHALLAFRTLLHDIQPGLLDEEIEPFRARIEELLVGRAAGSSELVRRVRIVAASGRAPGEWFQVCATALVERCRLLITYHGRGRDVVSVRRISPQRLVHYRDSWYLDAWCHDGGGLRTFALERIRAVRQFDKLAREIPDERLDQELAGSYGIFAGKPRHTAALRFSAERARWVADELKAYQNAAPTIPADDRYRTHRAGWGRIEMTQVGRNDQHGNLCRPYQTNRRNPNAGGASERSWRAGRSACGKD